MGAGVTTHSPCLPVGLELPARMAKRPSLPFALLLDESLDWLVALAVQALDSLAQLAVHPAPVSHVVVVS